MKNTLKTLLKTVIALSAFSLSVLSINVLAQHMSEASVEHRIAPIGQVCVEGEACKAAAVEVLEVAKGPRSAQEIVGDYCAGCHASGIMNAPKIGTADWSTLEAKGMDALLKVAKKGKGAMPRKGGWSDCSNEELIAAIQDMIDAK